MTTSQSATFFFATFLLLICQTQNVAFGQQELTFQEPPSVIKSLALAELPPMVSISPNNKTLLFLERKSYMPISELAEIEYRLAGVRFNPANFGPSRSSGYSSISIQNINTNAIAPVSGMPTDANINYLLWNKSGSFVAFSNSTPNGIELWQIEIATGIAKKWCADALNIVIGNAYSWLNDSTLIYQAANSKPENAPNLRQLPLGPVVQETIGKKAASRTYQDLLKSKTDELVFDFFATSQLKRILVTSESGENVGKSGLFASIQPSPDGELLLVRTIEKPFSYQVPWSGFPHNFVVLSANNGELVKVLSQNPSTEDAPLGFDDVPDFPRGHTWRNDKPQTIVYIKPLDGGLFKNKVPFRDAMLEVSGRGKDLPRTLFQTKMRFQSVFWGSDEAWVTQSLYNNRQQLISMWYANSNQLDSIQQRSSTDAYNDIGTPLTEQNEMGRLILSKLKDGSILLRSQGSSPKGDMPFLQGIHPKTKKISKIWQCQAPHYEYVIKVIDKNRGTFITSREGQTEPQNYFIRNWLRRIAPIPITNFDNPYAALSKIKKEKIRYKRADGIDLTATLYLPENFKPGTDKPLPLLLWAYPREYKSAADAAQVRGSAYTFTRLSWGSPIFWVTQGYAILDNAEMPIVGEGKAEPNDNFIPQLYLNAHAAIQNLAKQGIADSNRVGVGGHSYGAFMTANLLAHTKLFRAGIARSGAYNRTLTPFGFQSEQRNYWDAQEVYQKMSPFNYAKQINTPLLLIHGELDNNSGTFPIQSERMYAALNGLGGNCRYVVLPYESHGYAARENILHLLWEQHQWLEKYVKPIKINNK